MLQKGQYSPPPSGTASVTTKQPLHVQSFWHFLSWLEVKVRRPGPNSDEQLVWMEFSTPSYSKSIWLPRLSPPLPKTATPVAGSYCAEPPFLPPPVTEAGGGPWQAQVRVTWEGLPALSSQVTQPGGGVRGTMVPAQHGRR